MIDYAHILSSLTSGREIPLVNKTVASLTVTGDSANFSVQGSLNGTTWVTLDNTDGDATVATNTAPVTYDVAAYDRIRVNLDAGGSFNMALKALVL